MVHVAFVSEHASPLAALGGVDAGGQNVHVAALARELGRRATSVDVFTRRDDPRLASRVRLGRHTCVEHVPAGPPEPVSKDELFPYMDEFAAHLQRRWSIKPPDLVHSHFWMSGYAALAAARPLGIPVVHTYHALGVVKRRYQGTKDTSPPERDAVEHDILCKADRIIATCTDEVFELLHLGADPRRLSVVPCGVDTDLFKTDGPTEPRRGSAHRIVCVARLVERKGIGNAITALASVPNAEMIVAGGPPSAMLRRDPDARRLQEFACRVGVGDRVTFRGRVDHDAVPALLRSSDVVVCVPWYEPFGIVPLEAMACGVPVIASAVGGMTDSVVDGLTGVMVPARAPDKIAAALNELLDDQQTRQAMGDAGVDRVRSRFTWSRVGRSTLDVYSSLHDSRVALSEGIRP